MFIEFRINQVSNTSSIVERDGLALLMCTAWNSHGLPDTYKDEETNSKHRLQNQIISWLRDNQIGWTTDLKATSEKTFVETLAGALWYIDGHHDGLGARACHVPSMFNQFQSFNKPELHKKRKRSFENLKRDEIVTHSSQLFTILACS